jgi:hypothetical protein
VENTELRPLGAGELLDRAVTLFVRRFVPIVIVLAISIVPLMIIEAILAPNSAHVFSDLSTIFTEAAKPGKSGDIQGAMAKYNSGVAGSLVFSLIAVIVRLLMWSAIVRVVATAYGTGTITSPRDAYVVGINCWPAQIIVGIAFFIIGGVCSVPLIIIYFLLIAITVMLVSVAHAAVLAAIVAVIVGIALVAGFFFVGAFVYMTYELAAVFVVTETPNAVTAITAAFRRVSARSTWWRTALAGLVILAITQLGTLPFVFLATLLASLTHIDALYFAILGTGTILLDGLVATFAVVYATDVRIRREGLDLMMLTRAEDPVPVLG